jgi:hypothetical protein
MENNYDFNMRTGGWPMYNYYRDNAGMMPMQNPGLLPAQNANVMPVQNTGLMPMSNMDIMPSANIMPMQNMGLMPSANVMPMQNAGLMPAANVMPMCNPCNPMAMMPAQFNQFAEMPTEDLENLYPQTYNVIMPVVESTCDNWMGGQGDKCPSKKEYESMVSDIYKKVEPDVEAAIKNSPNPEERQFFGGGRRLLRDFIGALLISSLIRRRRRPFFGFGSPFSGGFYGYPYY